MLDPFKELKAALEVNPEEGVFALLERVPSLP